MLENQNLFKGLITITFDVEHKVSIEAAWILEWVSTHPI